MRTSYYKAVNMYGRDFFSNSVQWIPEKPRLFRRHKIKHPFAFRVYSSADAHEYLSVTDDPTFLSGARWPLRLIKVSSSEAQRPPTIHDAMAYPHKFVGVEFRFEKELDPFLVFGEKADNVRGLLADFGKVSVTNLTRMLEVMDNDGEIFEALAAHSVSYKWQREGVQPKSSERRLLVDATLCAFTINLSSPNTFTASSKRNSTRSSVAASIGMLLTAAIYDPNLVDRGLYEEISADFLTYLDVTLPPLPQGV